MRREEESVGEQMAAIARQATVMAREEFNAELDFSGDSLQMVEAVLREFADDFPPGEERSAADEENIEESIATMAMLLGAYIGEVVRRAVGGEWREHDSGRQKVVVLEADGNMLSPAMDVFERLTGASEESLWEHYRRMFPKLEGPGLVRIGS